MDRASDGTLTGRLLRESVLPSTMLDSSPREGGIAVSPRQAPGASMVPRVAGRDGDATLVRLRRAAAETGCAFAGDCLPSGERRLRGDLARGDLERGEREACLGEPEARGDRRGDRFNERGLVLPSPAPSPPVRNRSASRAAMVASRSWRCKSSCSCLRCCHLAAAMGFLALHSSTAGFTMGALRHMWRTCRLMSYSLGWWGACAG